MARSYKTARPTVAEHGSAREKNTRVTGDRRGIEGTSVREFSAMSSTVRLSSRRMEGERIWTLWAAKAARKEYGGGGVQLSLCAD